jgi:F-type H+-transporting ATPase subunit b
MRALTLVLAPLALVASAKVALAAEGGHGGFSFSVEGFYIIDFVIMAVILWAATKGPIKKFFLKRHQEVANEMEAATRLRKEAEVKLAELEKMFSGFEAEVTQIRSQFKSDGERERARILAQADTDAEKIRDNAKKTIEQEMAKLREQLEAELIDSVLQGAEARVRQRLDQMTQKRLASGYVDDLEKLERLEKAA